MKLLKKCFLAVLIISACMEVNSQFTGNFVTDLEPEIMADMLSIIVNGTVHLIGSCNVNSAKGVSYWLYTKEYPQNPIPIGSFDLINVNYPIKVLIHGWLGDRDVSYMQIIKDAYIQTFDSNIIVVDWGVYAKDNYRSAYCSAPFVGRNIAQFLSDLSHTLKINFNDIHVIGHSLGAQIAGLLGKEIKINGTIGRITGLDPAGPLYQQLAKKDRLDNSDATYVDVIHTNQGVFGYEGDCGDLDFYPNCGFVQPGCVNATIRALKLETLTSLPKDLILCNHQRSCNIFAESITDNDFPSVPCLRCGISPLCFQQNLYFDKKVHMGEYRRTKTEHREYVFFTRTSYPYGSNSTDILLSHKL